MGRTKCRRCSRLSRVGYELETLHRATKPLIRLRNLVLKDAAFESILCCIIISNNVTAHRRDVEPKPVLSYLEEEPELELDLGLGRVPGPAPHPFPLLPPNQLDLGGGISCCLFPLLPAMYPAAAPPNAPVQNPGLQPACPKPGAALLVDGFPRG